MLKKFLYYSMVCMMVIPAIVSCKNAGKDGDKNNTELPKGEYTFYGVIEPAEKILMNITVDDDGKIEGEYKPEKPDKDGKSTAYELQGSVFDKNKLTLYVTEKGSNQPIQTFNIFASKEDADIISLKGTLNDNQSQKISNVSFSTDKSLVDNLKAPSVEVKTETPKEPAEEKSKIVNNSPYPIAPGSHKFKGKAEGKWPIVVYLKVSRDGDVSGKMAYESTLKKYGDTPDHYMQLYGYFSGRSLHLSGEYSNGNTEEWDLDCSDNGYTYKLKGWSYNYNRDKEFTIDVKGS